MKKYKLKESVKNVLGVLLFYGILIFGVIALSYRTEETKKEQPSIEVTQQQK